MALVPTDIGIAAFPIHQSEEEKRIMEELEEIEREVAAINLDVQRYHEKGLMDVFLKRHQLSQMIPDFWSSIFLSPPESLAPFMQEDDFDLLKYVTKFFVDRHEISEDGQSGDPRSLRIIFTFAPNEFIENTELTKVFEYRQTRDGLSQGYSSPPVQIRWKSRSVDLTRGLGQKAWLLWQAEKAIEQYPFDEFGKKVTREELWQHERVLEALREQKVSSEPDPSFFSWFYYRGVDMSELSESKEGNGVDESGLLNAEIYPLGETLGDILAETVWVDALDLYNQSLKVSSPEPEDATMADLGDMSSKS